MIGLIIHDDFLIYKTARFRLTYQPCGQTLLGAMPKRAPQKEVMSIFGSQGAATDTC